jgi:hypothetical protein
MTDLKSKLSKIKFKGSHFEIKESTYREDEFYGYELSLKKGLWKVEVRHRNSKNQLETIDLYLNDKLVMDEKYIPYDYQSQEQMLEVLEDALEKFTIYIEEVEEYFNHKEVC